ncbi:MAG: hydrogenase [Nitrososphaerota archaeon]|jgi:hydrogenase-4 component E|nr:hydrogenase [Nitrososphaerota archaeon]MDG6927276.1 hydrogenase [Nitrososphaerota archaeon]MDG6930366.1 hydrogenase [Nitrososphaerota archaeon]MDG6931722.1 hydrogenase [Nitrososphaerota archaeon]MDG6936770.1 hydrogenase [Nitrososphaerota archaeon]
MIVYFEIVLMLVVINAFYIQGQAYIKPAIYGLGVESLIIGATIAAIGLLQFSWELLLLGILVITLRAFAITYVLDRSFAGKSRLKKEPTNITSMFVIDMFTLIFAIIIFQFFLIDYLKLNAPQLLFAIALFFQGLFLIASRKNTYIQVIGYVEEENAMILFGIFIITIPLLIEASVLLDVLALILVISIVVREKDEHLAIEELKG